MPYLSLFFSLLCWCIVSHAQTTMASPSEHNHIYSSPSSRHLTAGDSGTQLSLGYHYVMVNVSNHSQQPVQAAFAMETTKFIGSFWPFLGLRFEANQNRAIRADNPNGRLEYLLGNDENFASITFSSGSDSCTVYLKGCAQYMKFWCGGFFTASSDESHCSIRPTALNVFAVDVL